MKASIRASFLLFASAASVWAAPFEFSGYLTIAGQTRFAVTDAENGKVWWLANGQTLPDFTVTGFDSKEEVLSLKTAAGIVRLRLKDSKVENRDATLAKILGEEESRLATGQRNQERVFLTRVALYTLRRDETSVGATKIKNQELIIKAYEELEAFFTEQRRTGLATNFDVLVKTEDVLRAKWILAELKSTGKLPDNPKE